MTETMDLDDLNPNPKNPRKINDFDFDALKNSLIEFGDLSGIVFNRRTRRLVGGHQRTEGFRAHGDLEKVVQITTRFPEPNKVGTTALGYISMDGEYFAYREVDWPEDKEIAANIAANRISGEWDMELLAEWDQWLLENNPDLLESTGQTKGEVARLLGLEEKASDEGDENDRMKITLTHRQYEIVQHAIAIIRTKRNFSEEINRDLEANALTAICEEWLAENDVDNQEPQP